MTLSRFIPSIAADFLPTFMYCLGSRDFEVVQTALRNLPEYTLLCQGKWVSATFGACLASQGLKLCSCAGNSFPGEVAKGQPCLHQAIKHAGDLYQ